MTQWLKQSTAFTFRIGPFLDDTDGKTAETELTIAQGDIQISKAGGAFAQTSANPTTTHDADGWYQCPLTTTDTGTVGALTVQIAMAGALPVWKDFMVVPANVYDSLIGGSDTLNADVLALAYEGSETIQEFLRLARAVLLGKSSGGGAVYRDAADSKARVTATLDGSGNRTAVSTDAT